MADNRVSQQLEASFRGVTFRVRAERTSERGRKAVMHDYINSGARFVEDLGGLPPKFSIDAFVHGENFLRDAARLEAVLDQGGTGQLVMPTFGVFTVTALPYSKEASQTSVGEIKYTLNFSTGRPSAGPSPTNVDAQQVFSLGDISRNNLQTSFANSFAVPSSVENVIVAQDDLTQATNAIFSAVNSIINTESLANFSLQAQSILNNVSSFVRNPAQLASVLIGGTPQFPALLQEMSLGLENGLGFAEVVSLANFGTLIGVGNSQVNSASPSNNPLFVTSPQTAIPLWEPNTIQRIQRNNNRLNIVNTVRVASLITAYEVAAVTNFTTQSQINDIRQVLEDLHEDIMRDDTIDVNLVQSDNDVRQAVENVRLASLNVIGQRMEETFATTTSVLGLPSSSFVQAYRFYAEEFVDDIALGDRAIALRGLNPDQPSSLLGREINIFRTQ